MNNLNIFIPFSFEGKKVSFTQDAINAFSKSINPFIVCVYGHTGAGKSSLINRLLTKSFDKNPLKAKDGPISITNQFFCVGPIKIQDFQNIWNININTNNDYDLFFIDSVGYNAIDQTFEQEKDYLLASISLSTIASVELWLQKGRSNRVVNDVLNNISLSNALFNQFGKEKIIPSIGLIFNDVFSPNSQLFDDKKIVEDIEKNISSKFTQFRNKPLVLYLPSEIDQQKYIDNLKSIAKYISKKVGGIKYWPNMLALFNDTSESLKKVTSFNLLNKFTISNVWENYRKERIKAAEYNAKIKAEELIINFCKKINVKLFKDEDKLIHIKSIASDISKQSMNIFFKYINDLNLNDSEVETELYKYSKELMTKLQIHIENQAMISIDEKLFEVGREIAYNLQNLANSIYDNKYPTIINDIKLNLTGDFKQYTENKLSEMMNIFETQANNIYCNAYNSSSVEMIGQKLIIKTAFNMNYEYLLQKFDNYHHIIQKEDEDIKKELEKETKQFEEEKSKLTENHQDQIRKLKQLIDESLLKYKKYIKDLELILIEEINNYQTKQLEYDIHSIDNRNKLQTEHQNHISNILVLLSEIHSNEHQFLSDQISASTDLILHTNEQQHQITRILNWHETQVAKQEIIQFTNDRANDIKQSIIQESQNIKSLVHSEAMMINQNIEKESNLIHDHICKVNNIINSHISNVSNELHQHISVVGNGIHEHLNVVDSGIHHHLNSVDSGIHCHLNVVNSGIHQHISHSEKNINNNINNQSNYIMKEIKVNRVNFNKRFDNAQRYNAIRFNQIQKANEYYHRRQMIEHKRTQYKINDFHIEQSKWNKETTESLNKTHEDIIKGFEMKKDEKERNEDGVSIEPYVGASCTIGPLTIENENGTSGIYLKGFGGKIGFSSNGEFRIGYEISGGASAGVGVEGSMGEDFVFSLFKPPSVEKTIKGGISSGAGGQCMGIGMEAKGDYGIKTTIKQTLK